MIYVFDLNIAYILTGMVICLLVMLICSNIWASNHIVCVTSYMGSINSTIYILGGSAVSPQQYQVIARLAKSETFSEKRWFS